MGVTGFTSGALGKGKAERRLKGNTGNRVGGALGNQKSDHGEDVE